MKKDSLNKSLEEEQVLEISRALKQLRIDKGYSNYEALAQELNMARSQYGPYENGKNLTLMTLFKILNFHGITLTEFSNTYLNKK